MYLQYIVRMGRDKKEISCVISKERVRKSFIKESCISRILKAGRCPSQRPESEGRSRHRLRDVKQHGRIKDYRQLNAASAMEGILRGQTAQAEVWIGCLGGLYAILEDLLYPETLRK